MQAMKIARRAGIIIGWAAAIFPGSAGAQELRLDYSTYLGGTGGEMEMAVAVDSASCAYLAGVAQSDDFPTWNPYQASRAGGANYEIFVTKFSPSGSRLIYSTYLGGADSEWSPDIAVDSAACAYVAGTTRSADFPTRNAYQPTYVEPDSGYDSGFLTKFSSTGTTLLFSSYLHAEEWTDTSLAAVAVDSGRHACVTGWTNGTAFPVLNAYQPSITNDWGDDAVVARFSSTGSYLLFSTYLGGGRTDNANALALEAGGEFLVAGWTTSSDGIPFPTVNPYQSTLAGDQDTFVSRLSSTGSRLLFSTYLGGTAEDEVSGIGVAANGSILVCGWTNSSAPGAFPVVNAYQSSLAGSTDAFVARLSSSGSRLVFSSYLGGSGYDIGYAVVPGPGGGAYLCGRTSSQDFPTADPYQSSNSQQGYDDFFVTRISSSGSRLVFSSYLGGTTHEDDPDLAVDWKGQVFVAGKSNSVDFPVHESYQSTRNGTSPDAVLARLHYSPPAAAGHTDFDGDGTSDLALFRGGAGMWAIRDLTRLYLGTDGDQTVPGDYNGDGTTEIGVFRSGGGLWSIRNLTRLYFGTAGDQAVSGDYDGDGRWEIALFRDSESLWAIRDLTRIYFGASDDTPVPADFVRPGVRVPGIFRPSTGLWSAYNFSRTYFGASDDIPLAGDFDLGGDNETAEPCIFRPSTGLWALMSGDRAYLGTEGDAPVPADYDGDGVSSYAVFRAEAGLWAIYETTRIYFGSSGDIPVTE
jgi:hypothetical protein